MLKRYPTQRIGLVASPSCLPISVRGPSVYAQTGEGGSIIKRAVLLLICITTQAMAADTDGDGLLDLIDVPGFDVSLSGDASFLRQNIEDLDGANLLANVRFLNLTGNQITSMERGDFDGLSNLRELWLHDNQITSVENGDFDGLNNVSILRLSENRITSIESGDFDGLPRLTIFGLSDNQVTSIESGDFEGLDNLEVIRLNSNQITNIEQGGFDGIGKLRELWLADNRITSIESGVFGGLDNLELLRLSSNQIASIERGDFDEVGNLRQLWLDDNQITSIDSGDFEGLNLMGLVLRDNQITSIENGDFEGLNNLIALLLSGNQITDIDPGSIDHLTDLTELNLQGNQITNLESGVFRGQIRLRHLSLRDNPITELNLTRAEFENLQGCSSSFLEGFCLPGTVESLTLDDAKLSQGSFDAIVSEATSIVDVSLVGLTFSDGEPDDLSLVFDIDSLINVTVDQALFDQYSDEVIAFAAIDGNTLMVVPGLCDVNRDGVCDAADIDTVIEERETLIHRSMPHGFGTYFGDANLDGEFNSADLVQVFQAGEYEDGMENNSGWADGDWDGDGDFTSGDLVLAFQDGAYEQGPRVAAVPEPTAVWILLVGVAVLVRSRVVMR